ncbi:MAG: hypothetical protein ABIW76_21970 [Fibrobacteria bacterium]
MARALAKHYNDPTMLHILNGDATLGLIKESTVKGDFLVWKDMLMEGPVGSAAANPNLKPKGKGAGKTGGLAASVDWKARAAFLNRNYGIDPAKYLADMAGFFKTLDKAAIGKGEVVFWFEEDFFCQIHLVCLLANLPEPLQRKGRVSIICPEKPLGVRLAGAFPKLLEGRIPLEAPLLSLAAKVWSAYSAASSQGWDLFLKWARSGKGFEPWPLLKRGLRSHLGRLPSANGEPNAMETALLRSASAGHVPFGQFVRRVWSEPLVRPLGLGDLQVARYALDLAQGEAPLLAIQGPDSSPEPGKSFTFGDWKLTLTEAGNARLAQTGPAPVLEAEGKSKARAGAGKGARNGSKANVKLKVKPTSKPAVKAK